MTVGVDSNAVIPKMLEASGRCFSYYSHTKNLGYDGNVRFCLRAARGRYVFLLGNDDALAGPDTLAQIARMLQELDMPAVVFTNYEDWGSGEVVRRSLGTRVLGAGATAAVSNFRSLSFVSGLIYEQSWAARHETDRWDQSIYYQVYIGCRILAEGGRLGTLDLSAVRKDVRIEGQTVPNYISRWANEPWSFQSRHTGLDSVIRVTADAVLPLLPIAQRSAAWRRIVAKVLLTTYPFWLFEYRRVSNWSFAAGIAREMWPGKMLKEQQTRLLDKAYLYVIYSVVTLIGLTLPLTLFYPVKSKLADLVRYLQQSSVAVVQN